MFGKWKLGPTAVGFKQLRNPDQFIMYIYIAWAHRIRLFRIIKSGILLGIQPHTRKL